MIVPVQCEYLSLRGLLQLERTLEMIRENINPRVKIQGILPTLFDSRTLHGREAIEILKENFGPLVFNTVVRKTIKFAEAPVQGSSVLKYDPRGKRWSSSSIIFRDGSQGHPCNPRLLWLNPQLSVTQHAQRPPRERLSSNGLA